MRDINHDLVALFRPRASEETIFILYEHIAREWPQISSHTKLNLLNEGRAVDVVMPNTRMEKIPAVCKRKGWKAKLWRIAGDLLDKPKWIERGQYLDWNILVPPQPIYRVEMRPIGVMPLYAPVLNEFAHPFAGSVRCLIGYDPFNDTLHVKVVENVYD